MHKRKHNRNRHYLNMKQAIRLQTVSRLSLTNCSMPIQRILSRKFVISFRSSIRILKTIYKNQLEIPPAESHDFSWHRSCDAADCTVKLIPHIASKYLF